MQQDHLRRVADAYKHGDAQTKKALSSNSLQKSPTLKENADGNKSGNNQTGNGKNGKKNRGRNGNSNNTDNASTSGNGGSNGNGRGNGNTGGGNSTSSNTDTASIDNKKMKRRLIMAISCSVCGFECGHSDIDCYKDPNTEESKKLIEKNRQDSKMRDFFKAIDNAKKKRGI